jgi:anti-sigma regulatory factor (Ser/Thr protein kinase)
MTLRCDRSAPRIARNAVGSVPSIEHARDDVLLITTELVSNAVLHAGCEPGDEIEVVAELVPQALRITVSDVGRSGCTPEVRDEPYTGSGGMGLRLVQMLARGWGVERNHRLRVWAELAV